MSSPLPRSRPRFAPFAAIAVAAAPLFVASPAPVYAQSDAKRVITTVSDRAAALAALEKAVEAERVKIGIPGLALAIVEGDKVIFAKGFGYRDAEKKLPVTPDTLFAIGSSTKAFTALTVLQAQDKGKMRLDAHPREYLPYFGINDPETDPKITIRDLLCHRSGLTRIDLPMVTGNLSREELIRVAALAKPAAKLGEKFQYQNLMFTASGEAAARVAGKPYEKLVEDDIFKPLGMTHSTFSEKRFKRSPDHAQGYNLKFVSHTAEPLPFRDMAAVAPAGSINSSANDMTRWLRFWVRGDGTFEGKRLVSQAGFDEMTKKQMSIAGTTGYGLGWFLREWKGLKAVDHGGNIDGFATQVGFLPERKIGFVLLSNVSYSPLQSAIIPMVFSHLLEGPKPAAPTLPTGPGAGTAAATLPPLSSAQRELLGSYERASPATTVELTERNNRLTLIVPGQSPYPLAEKEKDTFTSPVLPEGFTITVQRGGETGAVSGITLRQPGKDSVFARVAAWNAPVTSDELLAKMVEAAGGAENLKKHRTRVSSMAIRFENQGMTGEITETAAAPNRLASRMTFKALGKPLGWTESYCDGSAVVAAASFMGPVSRAEGKALAQALIEADFTNGLLTARDLFEKIEIKKVTSVKGEDAYVVVKTPRNDALPITDYVSVKSFLLLRRDSMTGGDGGPSLPVTETFSDYRPVDGVLVAHTRTREDTANGLVTARIEKMTWDAPVDPKAFVGPAKK